MEPYELILQKLETIEAQLASLVKESNKPLPYDHEYDWAHEMEAMKITGLNDTQLRKRVVQKRTGEVIPGGVFRVNYLGKSILYYVPDLIKFLDNLLAEQEAIMNASKK